MRKVAVAIPMVLVLSTVATAMFGLGKKVTVADLPPVVVRTVPQSGDLQVDPSLKEISVTFSKDMKQGAWSWVTITSDSYPEFTGEVHYLPDKRTCVGPVKLRPGHAYAIAFNYEKYRNFQDAAGQPAMPYLLVFETKP
jgi:hypothetical protein